MEADLYAHVPGPDPPAARHHPGHRSDRLRQDDDALQFAAGNPQRRNEDHHDRGPGRIPAGRDQPDPGASEDRPDVRHLAAEHPASRPRHHPDRRNPRPGDGRERDPGVADRPPGVQHAAHERRGRRLHATGRHGRRAVPGLQHGRGGDGPAAGAHALPATARSRTARPPTNCPRISPASSSPPARRSIAPVGCRACRQRGLSRPDRAVRAAGDDRADPPARPRSGQHLGNRARPPSNKACARSARTAGSKSSPAGPAWTKSSASPREPESRNGDKSDYCG